MKFYLSRWITQVWASSIPFFTINDIFYHPLSQCTAYAVNGNAAIHTKNKNNIKMIYLIESDMWGRKETSPLNLVINKTILLMDYLITTCTESFYVRIKYHTEWETWSCCSIPFNLETKNWKRWGFYTFTYLFPSAKL